jgi:CHAD domain-containing protein/transposase
LRNTKSGKPNRKTMLLDDTQRARLLALSDDTAADEERRRNARIVLAYDDGADTRGIAVTVGLSESRTRYWRGVFAKYGMAMFDEGFAPEVVRRATGKNGEDHAFVLADDDREALQRRLEIESAAPLRQRITILLAYAEGRETDDIAREVGLSPSRTRFWRKTFERQGMAMISNDAPSVKAKGTPKRKAGPGTKAKTAATTVPKEKDGPGIEPDDSFAEAGRKVLRMYFEDMQRMEQHPQMDSDPEVVHKMRVATRRIRSAFEIFDAAFSEKTKRKFRKPLKQIAQALGYVRDLDVLLEHMRAYSGRLSPDDAESFAPLLAAWEEERMLHYTMLLHHLASEGYQSFRDSFRLFVDTPGDGALADTEIIPGIPRRIGQVAPEIMLRRYTDVLAYEAHLDTASVDLLHRLRIQCKKLRYAMECFVELLGPGGRKSIRQVVELQDYLGELQDGQAASDMITDFVSGLDARQSARPLQQRLNPAPLLHYLATRESHKHDLLLGVSAAWKNFRTLDTRKRMLRSLLP